VTGPTTESSPADLVRFKWQRLEEVNLVDVDGTPVLAGWPADAWYEPLRLERALFEEFARLPDEPEAFVAFAKAYGTLAMKDVLLTGGSVGPADLPLEVWSAHRQLLRYAVDLWDAIEEGRVEPLMGRTITVVEPDDFDAELYAKYEGRTVVAQVVAPLGETEEIAYSWEHSGQRVAWRDVPREQPIAYLERRNLSPTATARAALAQFVTRHCRNLSVTMVLTTAPGAPLRMTFQVESLIGAMWLQLALAIDGKRKYRSCPVCGRWWDATAARSDKLTCSDRCRKSKQRAQMTDAKEGD
jgi:hypothetical protein